MIYKTIKFRKDDISPPCIRGQAFLDREIWAFFFSFYVESRFKQSTIITQSSQSLTNQQKKYQ